MSEKPAVSIVIPSYNSQKYIAQCLKSLVNQKTNIVYEIILVDSGQDNTHIFVKRNFPNVRVIRLKNQTYAGAARNIGVKKAKGDIIAFIDTDCEAHPLWLEMGYNRICGGFQIVGGSIAIGNPSLLSNADHILTFNEFMPGAKQGVVGFVPTCNFFCDRDIFSKIGGFRNDLYAGEDTMFCYQAKAHGKIFFSPNIRIKHHNRNEILKFLKHHYTFGAHSARVRRMAPLRGSILAKYPLIAPFGLPLRTLVIFLRSFSNPYIRWRYLFSLPLIMLGIGTWSLGFFKQTIKNKP